VPIKAARRATTPDNKFVYVPHVKGNSALFQYAFDAATGRLEQLPGTPADDVPWGMAVSADGRFMAVTNFGSKTLSVYRIDAEGGLERLTTVDVEDRLMDVAVR
jgi:6-phosphogluconolactonase (cycloisomerase 2 family)